MKMPPLPEPMATVRRWTTNSVSVDIPPPLLQTASDGAALYTADQMRAYGEAVREECARVCMRIGESEYPTDIDDCIAAIRATSP